VGASARSRAGAPSGHRSIRENHETKDAQRPLGDIAAGRLAGDPARAPAAAARAAGGGRLRQGHQPRPLLAETFKTVSWSLLVCGGIALGRVAAKGQVPLEGVTGLLAAPLALTAANAVQKGVAEAVDAAGVPAGPAPVWVLAIKAAEYGALGLALEWVGRRAWHSAFGHLAVGLATGVVFGGLFLAVVVQSAPSPLSTLRCWPEASMSCCSRSAARWSSSSPRSSELTSIPRQERIGPSRPVLLRPASRPQTRFPPLSAPARSRRSRLGRCASWSGATGPASATAAISGLAGAWTATPALASTAWSGCAGPTAPNSQAPDSSVTPMATARRQGAWRYRWRRSTSGTIAGRSSGQIRTRSQTSASQALVAHTVPPPNAGVI
jgi:hypothetical protein